jgi:hypothetical protein
MNWKTVRLELARDDIFRRGSASRAFLLHVPIDEDGTINADAVARRPTQATVRRFWASEPDQFGHVEFSNDICVLRCGRFRLEEAVFHLDRGALWPGSEIIVRDSEGTSLLFRVASVLGPSSPGTAK